MACVVVTGRSAAVVLTSGSASGSAAGAVGRAELVVGSSSAGAPSWDVLGRVVVDCAVVDADVVGSGSALDNSVSTIVAAC